MTWVVTAGDRAAPCERVSVAGCVDDIPDVSFPRVGDFVKRRQTVWPPLFLLRLAASARLDTPMVVHFLVRGRVQGVGFRWFVHREAAEIGLRGWVRNTDTGEVEIVAAGDAESLEDLRVELRKGSRGSRVDAIIEHELAESEADSLGAFHIEGAW